MIYVIIGCLIIIGFLGYKLYQKQQLDQAALTEYNKRKEKVQQEIESTSKEIEALRGKWLDYTVKYNTAKQDTENEYSKLKEYSEALTAAREAYEDIVGRKTEEINKIMDEQRQKRQEQLDQTFQEKQALYDKLLEDTKRECEQQSELAQNAAAQAIQELQEKVRQYEDAEKHQQEQFESLRKPLMQYEMEKQQRLFYTIQLPEEYHDDIEFLLTTVAAKVQHPDIISKLVWSEYVKPNIDETFKHIEIKSEPGIYKLTNLDSGKAYIGKSTDVKKRIADHFKSSIGIKSIADQAVHHEILKTGFWNWTIEVITYCDKDKLSELEKYYIDFFKTKEFGFNIRDGG